MRGVPAVDVARGDLCGLHTVSGDVDDRTVVGAHGDAVEGTRGIRVQNGNLAARARVRGLDR